MPATKTHIPAKLLLWAVLLTALILLFQRFAPIRAEALWDERTTLDVRTEDGVRTMTLAEYLPCAVAAEMPVSFGPEALMAQAVTARTYVLAAHRHDDADVCTDSGCCLAYRTPDELRALWGGDYSENLAAVTAAVAATDGEYLTYGGRIIQAVFHASSAGATEDSAAVWAAQPYLVSVTSPETADTVADLVSTADFSPEELASLLGLSCAGTPDTWLGETVLDGAGRVESIVLGGQELSGACVRSALGLNSTAFQAAFDGERFRFTVAGHGHGVGMSQTGARLLAADGWSYREILAHYYPGTELVTP